MFKFSKNKSGFTLIELLVVIAIIGILSGVVVTIINSARNRAKVASVQKTMKAMLEEAEMGGPRDPKEFCSSIEPGNLGRLIQAVRGYLGDTGDEGSYNHVQVICSFKTESESSGGTNYSYVYSYGKDQPVESSPKNFDEISSAKPGDWRVVAILKNIKTAGDPKNLYCVDSSGFANFVPNLNPNQEPGQNSGSCWGGVRCLCSEGY